MAKSIRTNNTDVPFYWARSQAAHSNNRQFRTDGEKLYSYNLVIGVTLGDSKVLLDYTAAAGNSPAREWPRKRLLYRVRMLSSRE